MMTQVDYCGWVVPELIGTGDGWTWMFEIVENTSSRTYGPFIPMILYRFTSDDNKDKEYIPSRDTYLFSHAKSSPIFTHWHGVGLNARDFHGALQHFVLGGMGCIVSIRSFGSMALAQHSYFSKRQVETTRRMHVHIKIGFDGQPYVFSDKFNTLPWCVLLPRFLFC